MTRYLVDTNVIVDVLSRDPAWSDWSSADYRARGGTRSSPLPDFYIGAHAAVEDLVLVTRDAARIHSYFPRVRLVAPS